MKHWMVPIIVSTGVPVLLFAIAIAAQVVSAILEMLDEKKDKK